MKKLGKVDQLGGHIKDRHEFFIKNLEEDTLERFRNILRTNFEESKYQELVDELSKLFDIRSEQFLDTDLHKFEVIVPKEVFTCLLVGEKDSLKEQVWEYFVDMLLHSYKQIGNGQILNE